MSNQKSHDPNNNVIHNVYIYMFKLSISVCCYVEEQQKASTHYCDSECKRIYYVKHFGIHTKTLRGTEGVGQKSNVFMLLTFSLFFM